MWYVYILNSRQNPAKFYSGLTQDLKRRLHEHNTCARGHTLKFRPWELHFYAAFKDRQTAVRFETYLKTQAGRRFQKLRLQSPPTKQIDCAVTEYV